MFEDDDDMDGLPELDSSDPYARDVEIARLVEKTIDRFQGPEQLKITLAKPKKIATFVKAAERFKDENEIQVSIIMLSSM